MATQTNAAATGNNAPANAELVTPKKLLDAALKFGTEDTRGANALANLALLAVENADAGKIDNRNAKDLYIAFQAGKLSVTPEEYVKNHAPDSMKNQVSKLAAIIKVGVIFREEEYAHAANADAGIFASGKAMLEWAKDFHVESLKADESKQYLKDGSTYNAIVTVAQSQIKKENLPADATTLGHLYTSEEVQGLMTKEVEEKKERTLGDILLSIVRASYVIRTDKIGKDESGLEVVTREGIDEQHPAMPNVQQIEAHALEALSLIDPERYAEYNAEIAAKAAKDAEDAAEAARKEEAAKLAAKAKEELAAKVAEQKAIKAAANAAAPAVKGKKGKPHPEASDEVAALLSSNNPAIAALLASARALLN
jgi:hypothetical protein